MDYFKDAFGGFNPQADVDAAIKFSLDVLFTDHRVAHLAALISSEGTLGGIEGDPGWIIERRFGGDTGWPQDADFRAYVNPDAYSLRYPEFFCDAKTFCRYVQSIVDVYAARYPARADEVRTIQHALREATRSAEYAQYRAVQ